MELGKINNEDIDMRKIQKDIEGYNGLYEISNYGEVFSVKRRKFLRPKTKKNGYKEVHLRWNGKGKMESISRLVAKHFIDNPFNKPQVNHIDGNKGNNFYSNLEQVTGKENIEHAITIGLIDYAKNAEKLKALLSKQVICNETGILFSSTREAERRTGISNMSISLCARGKSKYAGKHPETGEKLTWRYTK